MTREEQAALQGAAWSSRRQRSVDILNRPLEIQSPWHNASSYEPEEEEQGPPPWLGWALFILLVAALVAGICVIAAWMGKHVI